MITIFRIHDPNLVKQYLQKEGMWKMASYSELTDEDMPDMISFSWIEIRRDNIPVGLLMIRPVFQNVYTYHGGVFKEHRNKYTPQGLKEVLTQLKEILNCQFITSFNPKNKVAKKLAEYCGLKFAMKIKNPVEGYHVVYSEVIE